jgi:hypothetical protein
MFQICHTDKPIFRCTNEICSRIIRDFGYVCESDPVLLRRVLRA